MPGLQEFAKGHLGSTNPSGRPESPVGRTWAAAPDTPSGKPLNSRKAIAALSKVHTNKARATTTAPLPAVDSVTHDPWDVTQLSDISDGDTTDVEKAFLPLARNGPQPVVQAQNLPQRSVVFSGAPLAEQNNTTPIENTPPPITAFGEHQNMDIDDDMVKDPYNIGRAPALSREKPQPKAVRNSYRFNGHTPSRVYDRFVPHNQTENENGAQQEPMNTKAHQVEQMEDPISNTQNSFASLQSQSNDNYAVESEHSRSRTQQPQDHQSHDIHNMLLRRLDNDKDSAPRSPSRSRSVTPTPSKPSQSTRKRKQHVGSTTEDLDFTSEKLRTMTYDELKSQPFDMLPQNTSVTNSKLDHSDGSPPGGLRENLAHYRSTVRKDHQAKFFADMKVSDWEDSGKWFIDEFSNIMKKMLEARTAKREISEAFENEISERQQTITNLNEELRKDMDGMRGQGQTLLTTPRGKKS